ncbi:GNAT family N-acetyltransferase [Streptomyces sp. NPDC054784]
MRITECREDDVELLDRHLPSPGGPFRHARSYARHLDRSGTLLVAWRDGDTASAPGDADRLPVGSCEVRWQGCEAPEVRWAHPDCPEIRGLGLWPEVPRAESTGTALVGAAERVVRERGHAAVGLGVEKNNPRAEALYLHLGYEPSVAYLFCWSYEDADGVAHQVADACTFMVKRLRGTAP